jgi:hypothetical protein
MNDKNSKNIAYIFLCYVEKFDYEKVAYFAIY